MSDTLYIQTEENVEVHHPHVYLQDIAKLSCTNSKILNHLRVLPVANLDPDKTGRYVISVMDLINDIQLKEPDLDICSFYPFILRYWCLPFCLQVPCPNPLQGEFPPLSVRCEQSVTVLRSLWTAQVRTMKLVTLLIHTTI